MKVVPVKLSDPLTDALDELVKGEFYTSRNDALRDVGNSEGAEERLRLQLELQVIA